MSRQSLEAFISKLQQDESLQKELREQLGDPAQGVSAEGLNKFAAGKGYDFNVEDIKGELSDKQLDSVAGGGGKSKSKSSSDPTMYLSFTLNTVFITS